MASQACPTLKPTHGPSFSCPALQNRFALGGPSKEEFKIVNIVSPTHGDNMGCKKPVPAAVNTPSVNLILLPLPLCTKHPLNTEK